MKTKKQTQQKTTTTATTKKNSEKTLPNPTLDNNLTSYIQLLVIYLK